MMPEFVVAATDAYGKRFGEHTATAPPTLAEAAALADQFDVNYVSARREHDITLYGRDADGGWRILLDNAPAPVIAEIRLWHDGECRPNGDPD